MLAIAICGIYVAILQHLINQLCIFKLLDKFRPKFLDQCFILKGLDEQSCKTGCKTKLLLDPHSSPFRDCYPPARFSAQNAFCSKSSCLEFSDHTHSFLTSNPENTYKGAGSFHDIRKSMKELCANDTSRYPKVLKIGPNHGCQ